MEGGKWGMAAGHLPALQPNRAGATHDQFPSSEGGDGVVLMLRNHPLAHGRYPQPT